jgi:hypothetical protein
MTSAGLLARGHVTVLVQAAEKYFVLLWVVTFGQQVRSDYTRMVNTSHPPP